MFGTIQLHDRVPVCLRRFMIECPEGLLRQMGVYLSAPVSYSSFVKKKKEEEEDQHSGNLGYFHGLLVNLVEAL